MALVPVSNLSQVIASETKKAKSQKRKKTQIVLQEEEYVDTIEHIIKRDFFPAVPAMEAVLTGQPLTPARTVSSAPDGNLRRNPMNRPSSIRGGSFEEDTPDIHGTRQPSTEPALDPEFISPKPKKKEKKEMRLAEFLARHTSEDNESFEEILDKDQQKITEKRVWLAELQEQADKLKLLHDDPKRTGMITTWEYKTINHLLFFPEGNYISKETNPSPEKEIIIENTRFPGGIFDKPKEVEITASMASAAKIAEGGIPSTPSIGGYKFVRTPSPMPHDGGETPMMTWGDIVGTPLRLDEDDVEQQSKAKAARFKVPDTPSREAMARKLDEKVMEKIRVKKKKKRNLSTPSPSSTPGRSPIALSPAGLKLLNKSKASIGGSDSQLRASYKSPQLFPSASRTPKKGGFRPTPSPFGLPSVTPQVKSPFGTPTPCNL